MIAITTKSSIKVNPVVRRVRLIMSPGFSGAENKTGATDAVAPKEHVFRFPTPVLSVSG
jgi:hypothetical protein